MRALLLLLVIMVVAATPLAAVQPDEILADPPLEARARDISAGLRCMVCQNQSIDDSDAPLARDLRILVRERLKAGDSDDEVKAFIVERYGEFVLLQPPFARHTLLLWLAPAILLACGIVIVWRVQRRRRAAVEPKALTPREKRSLARLMSDDQPTS